MTRTRKPVPVHNLKVTRKGKVKKRSFLWRMRRVFYLAALAVAVGAGDDAAAGNGGIANAEANGGDISLGDVNSGNNAGNTILIGG